MSDNSIKKDAFAAHDISVAPTADPEWIALDVGNEAQTQTIAVKTLDCQSLAAALLMLSAHQAQWLPPEKVLESVQQQIDRQMQNAIEALGAAYNESTGELLVTTGIGVLRFLVRPDSQAQAKAYLQSL
jgi:hypothetical protein